MNGTTHKCGGIALGAVATVALHKTAGITMTEGALLLAGASFGALLPDLDHHHSELGKRLKPVSELVCSMTKHRGFTHTGLCWIIITLVSLLITSLLGEVYSGSLASRVITGSIFGFFIWIAADSLLNSLRPEFARSKKSRQLFDLELQSLLVLCVVFSVLADSVIPVAYSFGVGLSIGYLSHLILDMFNPTGVPIFYGIYNGKISLANIRTGSHERGVSNVCNLITIAVFGTMFI